jgi:outer membrane protein OmpA-like peptidoglycan-associated protein
MPRLRNMTLSRERRSNANEDGRALNRRVELVAP